MLLALALALFGGRVLSGRVLAPDAKPLSGAQVVLVGPAGDKRFAETSSGSDGRFELRSAEEGPAQVFVHGEGVGVRVLALEAGSGPRALGDLTLVGPGALSGHVLFVDGHAAPDVELWAVPEDVATQPNALILCVEQAFEHELKGAGLFMTRVRTGLDGSFRLAGLREGRYMLRCPRVAVVLEPRSGYYQTTTENIALAVQSSRLRVRALDAQGHELVGARVSLIELNDLGAGRYQPGQVSNETVGGALACASFDVQQESPYGVRIEAKGFGVLEDLVLLAQSEYEQVHEYRLEPVQAPGRVRLVLKPPAGVPPPGPCEVHLVSPLYLAPDPEAEPLKLDEKGWLPPLAPGRYLFELRFQDAHGWYLPTETHEVLELASKAEREVELPLQTGGRFELKLSGPRLAQVELRVEGLEGQSACTLRFLEVQDKPARGLDLLPTGRYRVRASAPRYEDASAEVTLEPGKFTQLALTLTLR